ncbi:hypothetical protein BFP72_18345 [Reichenbachiella sp. 5M10]|uniref:glycosyltransferase family 4 protein n=1 Tax=Reichenbachiella sp. 5M10 TaxID=1889772 RepID=UPI000C15331E|nr:glycosyltransferase family 4 protein [Reichenbachiella sp. 5M10]PIB37226.1 hypothetical protein BFP72_18345 [Reichenbachiella sp. 5M10]
MRIAIAINTSWNIYNFRAGLIRALLDQKHEVIAIAPRDEYSQKLIDMGCSFYPVEISGTGTNPFADFKLFLTLKRLYSDIRPDIIYQYTVKPNIYGSFAARTLGIPVINNVSGLGTVFLNKGIAPKIAKKLYKWSFRKVNLIFFQNGDDQRDFLNQVPLPEVRSEVIPGSGINLEHFRAKHTLSTPPCRFLMISRLILDKGILEYLDAARAIRKQYPQTEFQLLGQLDENHARGLKKELLDTYINDGSIQYLGTDDAVQTHIDLATCVVLPSYREGTPKTLLEAAAMSRPIITTDAPGCREVVLDGQNGYLCQVKSSTDLQHKIRKIIDMNPTDLQKMGTCGRLMVEKKFDEQIIIQKYISETHKILD